MTMRLAGMPYEVDTTPSEVVYPSGRMRRRATRALAARSEARRGGSRRDADWARRIARGEAMTSADVETIARTLGQIDREADPIRWGLWGGAASLAWSRSHTRAVHAARVRVDVEEGPVLRSVDVRGTMSRGAYWRAWLDSVQRPTERQIRAQWRSGRQGIFPAQVRRYSDRIGKVLGGTRSVRRSVSDDELRAILLDDFELEAVREAFDEEVIRRGVRRAYTGVAARLLDAAMFDPSLDPSNQVVAQMITQVQQATKDRVAKLVRSALTEGVSVGDLQRALQYDHAFSPARSLTIARTETARTVSAGQEMAFDQAANLGVRFEKEWISSRDSAVRPTHVAMDGQIRQPGEPFDSESGASGPGPGLFYVAAEDINCRCVARPTNIQG